MTLPRLTFEEVELDDIPVGTIYTHEDPQGKAWEDILAWKRTTQGESHRGAGFGCVSVVFKEGKWVGGFKEGKWVELEGDAWTPWYSRGYILYWPQEEEVSRELDWELIHNLVEENGG